VTRSLTDETEATLRDDLAAANRILVAQGVLDAYGHASARLAPGSDAFLLSRSLAPASVTTSGTTWPISAWLARASALANTYGVLKLKIAFQTPGQKTLGWN